jgi:hypothetical protein
VEVALFYLWKKLRERDKVLYLPLQTWKRGIKTQLFNLESENKKF